jgi:hypothetical protein
MTENQSVTHSAAGITRRQNYREFAETVRPHIDDARAAGQMSAMSIASYLNRRGVRSHTGKLWSTSQSGARRAE